MAEQIYNYDPAAVLDSAEAIEIFMADAFETGNSGYIAEALGVVARAKGMSQIANEKGNPTLKTTLVVMQALGLDMTAKLHH